MHNILVPITSGRGVRNFLRSDIFSLLKRAGYQTVILVEPDLKETLQKDFEPEGFLVDVYQKPKGLEKKLLIFRYLDTYSAATNFSVKSETIAVKKRRMQEKELARYFFMRACNFLTRQFSFSPKILKFLDWYLFPKKWCKELFAKYKPVLVLSTDMITNHDEVYILECAQKMGLPIVASILSWDNLSGYGALPISADKIIVWNNIMKKQLLQWHNVSENQVYVAGAPQYDIYKNCQTLPSREEFLKVKKLDLKKKLITYTTAPPTICDTEDQILEIIIKALCQNKFAEPFQLLVRLHPKDNVDRYKSLKDAEGLVFDKPGDFDKNFSDNWNPSLDNVNNLLATLKHSDIFINVASTMTVEAVLFDKPVINVAFDGYEHKPYWESVLRYYEDYTHYLDIVRTGGVVVAKSAEELIEGVNKYLINPRADEEGRRKIVQEQVYQFDGRASERVANFIINYVKNFNYRA